MITNKIALPSFAHLRTELSGLCASANKYAASLGRIVRSALDIDSKMNQAIMHGKNTTESATVTLASGRSFKQKVHTLKASDGSKYLRSFPEHVVDQSLRAGVRFARAGKFFAGEMVDQIKSFRNDPYSFASSLCDRAVSCAATVVEKLNQKLEDTLS